MEENNFSTTHQKIAAATFLVIGMSALALSYLQFRDSITAPFEKRGNFHIKSDEEIEKERLDTLKAEDTDKDTLSDYDELYVFRTSPFLEDSDSDGLNDGFEVSAGSDPNCPKGKTCRVAQAEPKTGSQVGTTGSQVDMSKPIGAAPATTAGSGAGTATGVTGLEAVLAETFGDLSAVTPAEMTEKIQAMSGDELRRFLTRMGLPAESLEGKDESLLREVVTESLLEAVATAQQTGTEATETGEAPQQGN